MVERTPLLNVLTHAVLILGFVVLMAPIWIVFVAASHDFATVNRVPVPVLPGGHLLENLAQAWTEGSFGRVMVTTMLFALGVTIGKVVLSALSAFAIVYFRYRLRMIFFWMIFTTLMLPIEIRIVPTYAVAANALKPFHDMLALVGLGGVVPEWNLLNSYSGLILPLIATATGTFLYRQFFLTIPDELAEAAKMDGAGPVRFFLDVLVPLSRTNMAALATIMFVWACNQYVWPLIVVTDQQTMATATMQLQKLVPSPLFGQPPVWNVAMAATLIVMIPPLVVTILLQRWFVRGLVSSEK